MKKVLLLIFLISQICLTAQADTYMPLSSQINNKIFSPEETRPLMNLERTKYTNKGITNLEAKYSFQASQNNEQQNQEEVEIKKEKGFKSLFKGFVCEW